MTEEEFEKLDKLASTANGERVLELWTEVSKDDTILSQRFYSKHAAKIRAYFTAQSQLKELKKYIHDTLSNIASNSISFRNTTSLSNALQEAWRLVQKAERESIAPEKVLVLRQLLLECSAAREGSWDELVTASRKAIAQLKELE